ncbi:hypothetical protein QO004_003748 [Rhizobium mesoamericanum]|nr:hypothetical protein [Rhizobium mesoamericanum]
MGSGGRPQYDQRLAHRQEALPTTSPKWDFVNARGIINGIDKAEKIAGYARILPEGNPGMKFFMIIWHSNFCNASAGESRSPETTRVLCFATRLRPSIALATGAAIFHAFVYMGRPVGVPGDATRQARVPGLPQRRND